MHTSDVRVPGICRGDDSAPLERFVHDSGRPPDELKKGVKIKMKQRWLVILATLGLTALLAAGCKQETNENNTATVDASTQTSSTDTATTSSTMSTTDSTGTSATSTAANTGTMNTTASSLSAADKEFMTKAAIGGMAEVSMGQMASTKGSDAGVKAFGNRMVTDHSKANDELKTLATQKGMSLPTDVDAEHKNKADELSKKSGKDFDKAYMDDMVKDHEKDVAEFQKASQNAADADLKAWATKTLPTLQDHLKMARETKSKLK
jgi:putative membrane protein